MCSHTRLTRAGCSRNWRTIDDAEPGQAFIRPPSTDQLIFACDVAEKEHKAIDHRLVFCDQMITTEEEFVSDVRWLMSYWGLAISSGRILTRDQFQALFHNVDPPLLFQRNLLFPWDLLFQGHLLFQ
jgi:hypothetical protein